MVDKDVVLTVQKIESDQTERMNEQYEAQNREQESIAEQLAEEGVFVETVFIVTIDEDDYLMYYIECEDFDETMETFHADDSERTEAYRDLINETLIGGADEYHETRFEPRFHVVVSEDER